MPIKLTIHSLADKVKNLEDLSRSIQDASDQISSITNNLIQKQNLDAFLTSELFPNIDSNGSLLGSSGIMLSAVDKALLTVGFDKFTSGKYYTTSNEVKAGRWGLFMEPSTLTIGIPNNSNNDPNKGFQVVAYNENSTEAKNLIYAICGGTEKPGAVGIGPIFGREDISGIGSLIKGNKPNELSGGFTTRINNLYTEATATTDKKREMTLSVAGNVQIREDGDSGHQGNLNVENDIVTKGLYVDPAGDGNAKFKVNNLRTEISNGLWINGDILNDDDFLGSLVEIDYTPNKFAYLIADSGLSDLTDGFVDSGQGDVRWGLIIGNTGWYQSGTGRILCGEVDFYSDSRNKQVLNTSYVFDNYKYINVVDYYFKNDINKETKKGVLAQELEQIYPNYVKKTKGLVADIFQTSINTEILENNTVKITLKNDTNISIGDKLQIVERSEENNSLKVLEVLSPTTFIVEPFEFNKNEPVFIYGRYVEDYRTVDYNKIHMTTVEVVQELIKKTETLESENVQLKNTLSQFEARLAALESKV
jgi:hypothetical protein